ncbi:MAG TPA: hypothetical protein VJS63_15620 [Bradyrhizobium sp.]|nr:hypothetical protein [Bradyrhizobium sp.]
MEPQQALRTGVTASAIAHLSVVALVILFSDVHPFGAVTAEPIAVDIVTPQELEPAKPEPPAEPKLPSLDLSVWDQKAPTAAPQAAARAQQAAAVSTPDPAPSEPAPAQRQQAMLGSSSPGYRPPEPDLSVKYKVMLGLPPELPPSSPGQKDEGGYDASTASMAADVTSSVVAEFRRHLRTCSKLPASVAPSDHILVKLRVFMMPDGKLAGDPAVGGGSANIKAIELMQSAIAALKACQPYEMLPPDRYGEWKALDLVFTPKDFAS